MEKIRSLFLESLGRTYVVGKSLGPVLHERDTHVFSIEHETLGENSIYTVYASNGQQVHKWYRAENMKVFVQYFMEKEADQ